MQIVLPFILFLIFLISFGPHLSDLDRWVVGSGLGFGFWWLGMALLGLVLSFEFVRWVPVLGFGGWVWRCWV